MPVELGQQVGPGTNLARVADPTHLKAELRIAETQTKDIRIGQNAESTRATASSRARRAHRPGVDRTARSAWTSSSTAPLPQGARPDLSVDGTIELERLDNVIYVGRPAFGQENSTVGLFKLHAERRGRSRTQVKLGRSSVNTIEIVEGLQPGDQVILSDMSA